MLTDELDYGLPPELIARHPVSPRDQSRLLVYRRSDKSIEHRHFNELDTLLHPTDILITNDTRVIPARLEFTKPSGGGISGLFLEELLPGRWRVMLKTRGRFAAGIRIQAMNVMGMPTGIFARSCARGSESGQWIIEWDTTEDFQTLLGRVGSPPLPPYIENSRQHLHENAFAKADTEDYQTIYARVPGALAAPTAGLHFTPELLSRLARRGVRQYGLTLHVGLGTFLPVRTPTLEAHIMHEERFAIPAETIAAIRQTRATGGRIVAVGTTTVRSLESAADQICQADVAALTEDISASTRLMISPGYPLKLTDMLITNFHLPRSTLLALVSTLVGLDELRRVYQEAIGLRYRFYSFGDAMIIL